LQKGLHSTYGIDITTGMDIALKDDDKKKK
jgi:hypothetical protein